MQAFTSPESLRVAQRSDGVVTLTLNRPKVRNALDGELLTALAETLESLPSSIHIVCLAAEGPVFCAGADLGWMRAVPEPGPAEQGPADTALLDRVFAAFEAAPQVVVACVDGPAIGGGAGLAAASDIVVAGPRASFAFAEVRLGLVAATIAPFVVERMGFAAARTALLMGERLDARAAHAQGLVDFCAAEGELEALLAHVLLQLRQGGPRAHARTKALLRALQHAPRGEQRVLSQREILAARRSAEGQEGMAAFLARRRAAWCAG